MDILNDYHVSYPDLDRLGAGFLVVLVRGEDGSFAVYSGIVRLPASYNEETYADARAAGGRLVMERGKKESYERAVTFFPTLPRERYRI